MIDTSLALRIFDVDDVRHRSVANTLDVLLNDQTELGVTPQVLREMWNTLTRPRDSRGFGMDSARADKQISDLLTLVELWDDVPGISAQWRQLVCELSVRGAQVHDANLAAAALTHGAKKILTLNGRDFERFRPYGLEPMAPDAAT